MAAVLINSSRTMFGPNNIVAHNTFTGIKLDRDAAHFNTITRNSVFGNGLLGIEIAPRGVNVNDAGDADCGPNEQRGT